MAVWLEARSGDLHRSRGRPGGVAGVQGNTAKLGGRRSSLYSPVEDLILELTSKTKRD